MTSLLAIPTEILVSISGRLSTQDLGSFRLTCKHVEHGVFEWFQDEFFSKKQFFLSYPSLKALVDISKHPSFRKKLKHVIIATDTYQMWTTPSAFRDQDAAARYYQGANDQATLLNTGVDRELLTEAFANLENLETVGIRDFNASSRSRDNASWSSWGAPTVRKETGMLLSFHDPHSNGIRGNYTKHVFSTLLYALGKASSKPNQIEVLLRHERLNDDAFHVPEFLQPTTAPVLENLSALLLNIDLRGGYQAHPYAFVAKPESGVALREFLSLTPNLDHLRLNLTQHDVEENSSFIGWLGSGPVTFNALRTLDFGTFHVFPDQLFSVITKYAATLESLSLWKMGLKSDAATHGRDPNLWAEFFLAVATISQLQLKTLKTGMLKQDHERVVFGTDEDPTARDTSSINYTGKDITKHLEGLAQKVRVDRPVVNIPEQSDEEVDSDEDENAEHDDEEDEEEDEE